MITLSQRLEGLDTFEGLPICRTREQSMEHRAEKRLVVYGTGNVHVWDGDRGAQWDPDSPLDRQPAVYIGMSLSSEKTSWV